VKGNQGIGQHGCQCARNRAHGNAHTGSAGHAQQLLVHVRQAGQHQARIPDGTAPHVGRHQALRGAGKQGDADRFFYFAQGLAHARLRHVQQHGGLVHRAHVFDGDEQLELFELEPAAHGMQAGQLLRHILLGFLRRFHLFYLDLCSACARLLATPRLRSVE
jgi:hypothetical protein